MTLRLFTSNRLEILAEALAEALRLLVKRLKVIMETSLVILFDLRLALTLRKYIR